MGPRTRIIALLPYCLTALPTAIQASGVGCQVPAPGYPIPGTESTPRAGKCAYRVCILHLAYPVCGFFEA
jgi:hypothetical protein